MGNLSTPKSVHKLQKALHAKAKAEADYRFYALYDKISREDILAHAYARCRSNKGAPGVDGQSICPPITAQQDIGFATVSQGAWAAVRRRGAQSLRPSQAT